MSDIRRQPYRRLLRCSDDRMIGGVCSGLAYYFRIDVVLIRIIFVLMVLGVGSGLLAYIILWIIAPEAPAAEIMRNME